MLPLHLSLLLRPIARYDKPIAIKDKPGTRKTLVPDIKKIISQISPSGKNVIPRMKKGSVVSFPSFIFLFPSHSHNC